MGPSESAMHVVSYKAIRIFCQEYPRAYNALDWWYRVAKRAAWDNFAEVKQSFSTADYIAPFVVFDIGGNKYRLIAEINFARRVLFIRRIMTHKEYDKRRLEIMSATLTVDRNKYTRLANRIVVKAIETQEEYDRMVAAVEALMNKGQNHLSP